MTHSDLRAHLKSAGYPVAPVEIDELPARWRALLPDWLERFQEMKKDAQKRAKREAEAQAKKDKASR